MFQVHLYDYCISKEKADLRKDWLGNYDRQNILNEDENDVNIEDFINYPSELINKTLKLHHFLDSITWNLREIINKLNKKQNTIQKWEHY